MLHGSIRMEHVHIEEIDLLALAQALRAGIGGDRFEASYLRGKGILRDLVRAHLGCSDAEAEDLVETLELQGFVRFPHLADETHPAERHMWIIDVK
jgi:hypothetical protein